MGSIGAPYVPYFRGYQQDVTTQKIAAGGVTVRYQQAGAAMTVDTSSVGVTALKLNLAPKMRGTIVPGSLRFSVGGDLYIDRGGVLYRNVSTANGSGVASGTVNYATGEATITAWPANSTTFTLESGLIRPGTPGVGIATGRTAARPLKSQSFTVSATAIDGTAITATSAADGKVSGTNAKGLIDIETGVFEVAFGAYDVNDDWQPKLVDPSTMRFNAVAYSYLPLDADLLGLDPVRLPQDGRVPIFRPGGFAVVGHTGVQGPYTVANGQTKDMGRVRLSRVRVIDANGNVINAGYTANLEAGTVTFTDVTGYVQPVTIEHRIEDMAQVSDVQISGQLSFTRALSHDYPTGSVVSSALVAGDMRARVSVLFDQGTWNGTYTDAVVGSPATGTYNDVLAPIVVTNKGASTERWAIQFTNTTSFNVIGEHVGVIATGNTSTTLAPINPATGEPYFTLSAVGWGSGWSAGNVLRFNTVGALFPVWVVRTIQQGPETVTNDSFTLLARGDVDRP